MVSPVPRWCLHRHVVVHNDQAHVHYTPFLGHVKPNGNTVTEKRPSTLGERIYAIRERLGSVTRPLSLRDAAKLLSERLPTDKRVASSTLERWEKGLGGEPPIAVLEVMAELAGISFEEFATGRPPNNGEAAIVPGPPPHNPSGSAVEGERRRSTGRRGR